MTDFKSGGISRPYDNRDFDLGRISTPTAPPVTFETDVSQVAMRYQNGFPTCGAHAGTHMKNVQEIKDTQLLEGVSPRFLWWQIKKIDTYALEDGTDMRSIFKVLSSQGSCKYNSLPNPVDYKTTTLADYSYLVEKNETEKARLLDEAQPYIIRSGYGFLGRGFTLNDLRTAIAQYGVVLMLIRCDDGFFGRKIPMFTTRKYGHFVIAYGYDQSCIKIIDSTETDPLLRKKEILNVYFPFIQEVGTTVDMRYSEIKALIDQKNMLTKVVELYRQLIAQMRKK